jgi:hypothetical protein
MGCLPYPFVKVALGDFGFAQMQAVGDFRYREGGFLSQSGVRPAPASPGHSSYAPACWGAANGIRNSVKFLLNNDVPDDLASQPRTLNYSRFPAQPLLMPFCHVPNGFSNAFSLKKCPFFSVPNGLTGFNPPVWLSGKG